MKPIATGIHYASAFRISGFRRPPLISIATNRGGFGIILHMANHGPKCQYQTSIYDYPRVRTCGSSMYYVHVGNLKAESRHAPPVPHTSLQSISLDALSLFQIPDVKFTFDSSMPIQPMLL